MKPKPPSQQRRRRRVTQKTKSTPQPTLTKKRKANLPEILPFQFSIQHPTNPWPFWARHMTLANI